MRQSGPCVCWVEGGGGVLGGNVRNSPARKFMQGWFSRFTNQSKTLNKRYAHQASLSGTLPLHSGGIEDVPPVDVMYFACQVRVTVGDSGLYCCVWVTYFEH